MPTDSIADIDATLANLTVALTKKVSECLDLRDEAELCRQALVEAQAEIARLERELEGARRLASAFDRMGQ